MQDLRPRIRLVPRIARNGEQTADLRHPSGRGGRERERLRVETEREGADAFEVARR